MPAKAGIQARGNTLQTHVAISRGAWIPAPD
jgi:hypothetical protein